MDNDYTDKVPFGKSALDARYMPKVPDRAHSEEMIVLCPIWDLAGPCGMHIGLDGRPSEDHRHNQFVGAKECETVACYVGTYDIL